MRIAVIADIHGNFLALEAVLADAATFSPDVTVNLGDCISGPLWPRETFEKLESLALPTVRGNHDRSVANDAVATMWASDRIAYEALSANQRKKLGELPFVLEVVPDVKAFHASPKQDDLYLLDAVHKGSLHRADNNTIHERLADFKAQTILCGHSHRQDLVRLNDDCTILNPGSVGCPGYVDDRPPAHIMTAGSPYARYAIIDLKNGKIKNAMFRAVSYDFEMAAERALRYGETSWAQALRTGFIVAAPPAN